jgi:hypothetical protein
MWWALAGIAGAVVVLILLVQWYARVKYKLGKAETENSVHREAQKRRRQSDEVLADPIADESDWLRAQRERLQDSRSRD